MNILGTFGFQPILFAAQIVNFLILVYVFRRYLYGPILKTLQAREDKIKKGLTDADKAAAALLKANEEHDKIIKKAAVEAEKMIDDTKKAAEVLRAELLTKARNEADKMVEDTKKQNNNARAEMERNVKKGALDLSAHILEKVLSNIFSKDERDIIMKYSMGMLKKSEME